MSPAFMTLDQLAEDPATSSVTFSGPISPPLAFDGASDTSAASFSNGSPADRARANLLGLGLRGFVRGDVDASRVGRNRDEDLAQRDRRRRRELVHVRVVVLCAPRRR